MGQTATKTKQQVERTATKTKQLWHHVLKESFACFVPFRRWNREPAEETQPKDEDDIQEDRPLLRHRAATGFAPRTNESISQEAGALRSRVGKLGKNAMPSVPTPMRQRNFSVESSSCCTTGEDDGTFEIEEIDLEDIWEIGSDDEEEQPFYAHSISSSVGASNPIVRNIKVPPIGTKINLQPSGTLVGSPTSVYYVGTPRDCP